MWTVLLVVLYASTFVPLNAVIVSQHTTQYSKSLRNLENRNCTNWGYGPCLFKGGARCGIGKKVGRSIDAHCLVKEKLFKCKISCGCQYKTYTQGSSRKCDPVTNKRVTSLQLTRGDPTKCAQTKVVYKNCKKRRVRSASGLKQRQSY